MARQRKQRRPGRRPVRRPLNLGYPHTVTFYVVRFIAKVPEELREGTDAPAEIKKESPPTLDEVEARAAYRAVVDELMSMPGNAGIRSPQLIVRTVTEDILADYDSDLAASMAEAVAEELGVAAPAEATDDV